MLKFVVRARLHGSPYAGTRLRQITYEVLWDGSGERKDTKVVKVLCYENTRQKSGAKKGWSTPQIAIPGTNITSGEESRRFRTAILHATHIMTLMTMDPDAFAVGLSDHWKVSTIELPDPDAEVTDAKTQRVA